MAELPKNSNLSISSHCHVVSENVKLERVNSSPLSVSSLESKQIRRRSVKMDINSSACSKRSRLGQMEALPINEVEVNDAKEKSQIAKTKNGLNGKRVDRRNGKLSMKNKYDFFSLKAGMVSFNSGGGGNNSLGTCGLKPDAYDITKHLDAVTVNELLDDNYKGPTLAKDEGKMAANLNDSILNSVRNVCSILQRKKPLKVQIIADIDDAYNCNVSATPMCVDASENDNEKGDVCVTDLSYDGKVQPKVLNFLLCQPKDIIQRVGLPPSLDVDALLADAAKPVIVPKDSIDSRGKQIPQRASFPYFDAIKFSMNKSACHGKWARIDNTAALFEGKNGFLDGLESLNYDPKLVPVKSMKYLPAVNHADPCISVTVPSTDFCSSSSATCSRSSQLSPEYSGNLKCAEDDGDSPRSLVAAQTLCDIFKQFPKQELNQRMTWPNRPHQTLKSCKSKTDNKFRERVTKPKSAVSSHDFLEIKEMPSIFKKPRLLNNNNKGKDLIVPISSTQSPSKSYRDAYANVKSYNSFMMPPPNSRVLKNDGNNRQRLR